MKRLALDKDGNMTICVAKPGNEGQFGCTHVMHQKDGQSMEDFVEQISEEVEYMYYVENGFIEPVSNERIPQLTERFVKQFESARNIYELNSDIVLGYISNKLYSNRKISDETSVIGSYSIKIKEDAQDIRSIRGTYDIDLVVGEKRANQLFAEVEQVLQEMDNESEVFNFNVKRNIREKTLSYVIVISDKDNHKFNKIKIDIDFTDDHGASFGQFGGLKEDLKRKLKLSIDLPDRRFKDKVDLVGRILKNYPEGVTKKEFVNLLGKDDIEPITEETYRKLVNSSNNFKPAEVVDDTIVDYVNLINGLSNKNIGNNMVFINGRWQPK